MSGYPEMVSNYFGGYATWDFENMLVWEEGCISAVLKEKPDGNVYCSYVDGRDIGWWVLYYGSNVLQAYRDYIAERELLG